MSTQSADRAYYERRAEAELLLAQEATDPQAVEVHYDRACQLLDLAHPGPEVHKAPSRLMLN